MRRAGALAALALTACTPNPQIALFRANLDAHDSATLALEQWCGAHHLAEPARIEAVTMPDSADAPAGAAIRARLGVGPETALRQRHVHLTCGSHVLSDARNWYVPDRLTPAMNATLDTTRTPFGKVVAPLGLHRSTLTGPAPAPCPRGTIVHVSAVLRGDDGRPYSLVSECYTRANIAKQ